MFVHVLGKSVANIIHASKDAATGRVCTQSRYVQQRRMPAWPAHLTLRSAGAGHVRYARLHSNANSDSNANRMYALQARTATPYACTAVTFDSAICRRRSRALCAPKMRQLPPSHTHVRKTAALEELWPSLAVRRAFVCVQSIQKEGQTRKGSSRQGLLRYGDWRAACRWRKGSRGRQRGH
jgi:hypothetical protein